MTMTVLQQLPYISINQLASTEFKHTWSDHFSIEPYLYRGEAANISPALSDQFIGDFYGLLTEMGFKYEHFWYILRINGMFSPEDWLGDKVLIYGVNTHALIKLLERYLSTLSRL